MLGQDERHQDRFRFVAAVHLFLLRAGPRGQQVLLLRRANTGYEDGKYSVIAGHLDGGETVIAAAAREACEEAGITIQPDETTVVGIMHRRASDGERIDFFLAATTWQGTIINAEPDKCDELAWYDLDTLPPAVIPYVRQALANYRRGVWFGSFGWPVSEETGQ